MKRISAVLIPVCLGSLVLGTAVAHGQSTGSIVGWGSQVVAEQSALEDCVAIAGGGYHSLCLKPDGSIVAWGNNWRAQCDLPVPNANFVAVTAGGRHSLGRKSSSPTAIAEPGPFDMAAAAFHILSVAPNPFHRSTAIHFEMRAQESVNIEIYDVGGRRVATLPARPVGSGRQVARWSGRSDSGQMAGSGVYFFRLEADGHAEIRKVVKITR